MGDGETRHYFGFLYEDGKINWTKGCPPRNFGSFDYEIEATFIRHCDAWVRSNRDWYADGW